MIPAVQQPVVAGAGWVRRVRAEPGPVATAARTVPLACPGSAPALMAAGHGAVFWVGSCCGMAAAVLGAAVGDGVSCPGGLGEGSRIIGHIGGAPSGGEKGPPGRGK